MKITTYELLGMVKDEPDRSIYVKYFDRVNKKEDVMWACKGNIIYKLNRLIIELNDEVEVCSTGLTVKKAEENLYKFSEALYKEANKKREKKIPEKLNKYMEKEEEGCYENILRVYDGGEYEINEDMSFVIDKINEIIDFLKSKGE